MEPTRRERRLLDRDLRVLAAARGDAAAYRVLVDQLQAPLWRHALRLVGHEDAAWDVVQETWLRVSRGLGALRDPRRLRSWVFGNATRCARDWRHAWTERTDE